MQLMHTFPHILTLTLRFCTLTFPLRFLTCALSINVRLLSLISRFNCVRNFSRKLRDRNQSRNNLAGA
jgi:hypothetical protein